MNFSVLCVLNTEIVYIFFYKIYITQRILFGLVKPVAIYFSVLYAVVCGTGGGRLGKMGENMFRAVIGF